MLEAGRVLDQMDRLQAQAYNSQQCQDDCLGHPAQESSACSKQHTGNEAGPDLRLDIDMPSTAEQQNDVSPPQEPASSSTTYAHDGVPCSSSPLVASAAAAAADGAHQLASTRKSSSERVTSPFALPAQQAQSLHKRHADSELGIDERARLHHVAVLPEQSASQSPQLCIDTTTPCDVADDGTACAAKETHANKLLQNSRQPLAHEVGGADVHVDNAKAAVRASQSPRGTILPIQDGMASALSTSTTACTANMLTYTSTCLLLYLHHCKFMCLVCC